MLSVQNLTRATQIATRVDEAYTLISRMKGLLGRGGLKAGEGLWISPCRSIHTFFMSFPIDVAFIDANGRVVYQMAHVQPYRLSRYVPGARGVLELCAGALAASLTQCGDHVRFGAV